MYAADKVLKHSCFINCFCSSWVCLMKTVRYAYRHIGCDRWQLGLLKIWYNPNHWHTSLVVMGISSEQFRISVGLFNNRNRPITCINSKCQVKCGFACVNQRSKKSEVSRIDMCEECQNFIKLCILSIGCAIYFYLILYLYFLTIDLAAHCVTVSHASKNIHIYTPIFNNN